MEQQKRLIITGFPCPTSAWETLFPASEHQKIMTLADVFIAADSAKLQDLAYVVSKEIINYKPTSIVLHDFGAIIGIDT